MKKNDFKMLESIGSVLSKDELKFVIGGEEHLQGGNGTPTTSIELEAGGKKELPCAGKREGASCTWNGKSGHCKSWLCSTNGLICWTS